MVREDTSQHHAKERMQSDQILSPGGRLPEAVSSSAHTVSSTASGEHGKGKFSYRPDIDGLRAVAVLLVVAFHAFPVHVLSGFMGVDVFFVISGYLITGILIKDIGAGRFSIMRFYERRVKRIFPALLTVLTFLVLFSWSYLLKDEYQKLGKHILSSLLFVQNFTLVQESGYFDTSSHLKPLLHLWSLSVEEQFYLLWPIVLFFFVKKRHFVGYASFLVFASFFYNLWLVKHNPTEAYYWPMGRFWELLIGGLLAYGETKRVQRIGRLSNLLSVGGALLFIAGVAIIKSNTPYPGVAALLPTLGTAFFIAAGKDAWINRNLLGLRPVVAVGLVSYPLYLWHWVLLALACIYVDGSNLSFPVRVSMVTLSIVLSVATYKWIEGPLRFSKNKAIPGWLLGYCGLICVVAVCMMYGILAPRLKSIVMPTGNEWSYFDSLPASAKDSDGYPIHADKPHLTVFFGDSVVAQYAAHIARVTEDPQANGSIFVVGPGCIAIPGVRSDLPERKGCARRIERELSQMDNQKVTTAVVGGGWYLYFRTNRYDDYYFMVGNRRVPLRSEEGEQLAMESLGKFLKGLTANGKTVYLLLSTPLDDRLSPRSYLGRTRIWGMGSAGRVSSVAVDPSEIALSHELKEVAKEAGVRVIDPMDTLSKNGVIDRLDSQGQFIFRDSLHFNPAWALTHATFIDPTVLSTTAN
jgi:peptidoglycan/LPS O-acetylase OafA/YrhL